MDQLLTSSKPLLPGFRFHPTDEELFVYYLKRKCMGKSLSPQMMSEVDVYQFPPWDLPEKSWMKTRDLSWFFFCPRSKKYARGSRTNRSTEHGYWKSTGNDRTVNYNNRPVGKIKTLIFHLGKAPNGDRTDWVMHEYRLEDKALADKGVFQDLYAICKVYKKSGQGPKNGENYGAPFVEEDWETDDEDEESLQTGVGIPLANEGETQSVSAITNTLPVPAPVPTPVPITPMMNDGSFLLDTTPITPLMNGGSFHPDTTTITPMMNDGSFLLDTTPIAPIVNGGSFLLDTTPITPMMNSGSCSFLEDIDPTQLIEGDELEQLLAMFTEDGIDTPMVGNEKIAQEPNVTPLIGGANNVTVGNDVYHGLGDLAQTSQTGFSWSQLAGEIGKGYYIDIDDIDEILNR